MNKPSRQRTQLRSALQADGDAVIAPLCLDALTARIAAAAGFTAGYVSGGALGYSYGVSEALLTVTEISDLTRRIIQPAELPIIVDGGVGFGDAVHLTRTIADVESSGAAAIEIEDQVAPKRVSHHRGIEHLIGIDEMVAKIEVAAQARSDLDFLIIARTGAVKNESFDAAIERANAYLAAGADVAMLMPADAAQRAEAPSKINGPLATIASMDARSPGEWGKLGWRLVIDPFTAQVISVRAIEAAYRAFMAKGATGEDPRAIFDYYGRLPELAGLLPLFEIESQTTEKDDQAEH